MDLLRAGHQPALSCFEPNTGDVEAPVTCGGHKHCCIALALPWWLKCPNTGAVRALVICGVYGGSSDLSVGATYVAVLP